MDENRSQSVFQSTPPEVKYSTDLLSLLSGDKRDHYLPADSRLPPASDTRTTLSSSDLTTGVYQSELVRTTLKDGIPVWNEGLSPVVQLKSLASSYEKDGNESPGSTAELDSNIRTTDTYWLSSDSRGELSTQEAEDDLTHTAEVSTDLPALQPQGGSSVTSLSTIAAGDHVTTVTNHGTMSPQPLTTRLPAAFEYVNTSGAESTLSTPQPLESDVHLNDTSTTSLTSLTSWRVFHNTSFNDTNNYDVISDHFDVTDFASWGRFANISFNGTGLGDLDVEDVITNQPGVRSDGVLAVKAVTLALLAVGGVVGNAYVIWSVVRQRHLHRPPFYYLLSLSLTDLSRAAFCLPLVLMTLLQGSVWRHGGFACDLFAFANAFFVLSSAVSLLNVAADRHLSLVYPRGYRRRAGGALNLVVVLLGWVLAFLVAFPPVLGVGAYVFQAGEGQCTLEHKFFRRGNDTLGFLLVFTLLLLLTLFLYSRIFLALRAHRRMRPLERAPARSATWTFFGPGGNGQGFLNGPAAWTTNRPAPAPRVLSLGWARTQHLTRMFFLMTVAFSLAWLPYQVLSYWRVFGSSARIGEAFVTASAWLSYGQVVVCPLVYFSSRRVSGTARRRSASRGDDGAEDKQQELLLDTLHRKK